MERFTVWVEKIMATRRGEFILGFIAMAAPLYFLKTLYAVWFGPTEVFVGFQSERWTWLVLGLVDMVAYITTLPSRRKGLVMRIIVGMWTVEMFLVFLATLVR